MRKKLTILFYYLRAKLRFRASRHSILRWQNRRRAHITHFAKTHSLFYRNCCGELLSKKIMMDHFSSFNTQQIDKGEAFAIALAAERSRDFQPTIHGLTVGLSSGTSGNRGLFLVSEQERLAWCGAILAKILPRSLWYRQKVALFLRANSTLYETIGSGTISFAFFDLLEDLSTTRKKLTAYDPDVLIAPPSVLLRLAGTCQPKRVISVAEVLTSNDERRLADVFSQKIFQIYQCTEGFLGFTCPHGTLHLNEDLLIIEKEYIDDRRFIPIITDLYRTTQPIIRYRLDDILVEKKTLCPCGCSFLALERIEGRCDDVLYIALPQGGIRPLFSDFVSRRIIFVSEKIEEYEVVQTALTRWMIYVKSEFRPLVEKALRDLCKEAGGQPPEFVFVDQPLPRPPSAKLRRIRREYETV
jgi:putative adenylate-forming enzyme